MLPPILMVSEPGSFAEHTIVERKPQIIDRIIATNDYPRAIVAALRAFETEIAQGVISPPSEDAWHGDEWRRAWGAWQGRTWRQLAWFFAEAYFYRRILEITRYFVPGPWYRVDPFAPQKAEALSAGLEALSAFAAALPTEATPEELFSLWVRRSLWGNRDDLSNITIKTNVAQDVASIDSSRVLIDHSHEVWRLLSGGHVERLDWIADNSGLELLSDLGLLALWLSRGWVQTIHLHLKPLPFFVSDAMVQDFAAARDALRSSADRSLSAIGHEILALEARRRLLVHDHPFWSSHRFFSALPGDLGANLDEADLVVFKGDANYRRLAEDRHWPVTTPMEEITSYLPTPFLTMRTLKSELVVGLPAGMAERLEAEDPRWLVNGERGVIHLCSPWRPE